MVVRWGAICYVRTSTIECGVPALSGHSAPRHTMCLPRATPARSVDGKGSPWLRAVHCPSVHPVRAVRPSRASVAARVQDQPNCVHQDKLLLQQQRQHRVLRAKRGHGRPAGAAGGHRRPPGTRSEHARAVGGRVAAVQLGRGVLADRWCGDWRGRPDRRRRGRQGRVLLPVRRARGALR